MCEGIMNELTFRMNLTDERITNLLRETSSLLLPFVDCSLADFVLETFEDKLALLIFILTNAIFRLEFVHFESGAVVQ